MLWTDRLSAGTVVYTPTTIRLFDGCSTSLARLVVRDDRLRQGTSFGPASMCTGTAIQSGPKGAIALAQQRRLDHFYAVVAGPAAWKRTGAELTLTTSGKGTVHLVASSVRPPMMVSTAWHLVSVTASDSDEHPASEPLTLTVDGRRVW